MKKILSICYIFSVLNIFLLKAQWIQLDNVNNSCIAAFTTDPTSNDNNIAFRDYQNSVFTSTDNGASWKKNQLINTSGSIGIICLKGSHLFVPAEDDSGYVLFYSHDFGKTWKYHRKETLYNKIIFLGNVGYFFTEWEIERTTDFGETFTPIFGNCTDCGPSSIAMVDSTIFISISIPAKIGKKLYNDTLWRASDWNWVRGSDSLGTPIILFTIDDVLYYRDGNIFSSTNMGISWNPEYIADGKKIFDITFICGNKLSGWTKDSGAFITKDFGISRRFIIGNLRNIIPINSLGIYGYKSNYIFSGGIWDDYGYTRCGLYRAKMKDCEIDFSSDMEDNISNISEFLSPNPASDFIEISGINRRVNPTVDNSDIKIYDIFGQNYDLTPALSTTGEGVRIDVSTLSPGMYFVRIGDKVTKFIKL